MNRDDELVPNPCTPIVMQRATVCFWADSIEEKVEFNAWQIAWQRKMMFVSHDYGCGWCIHLFDLEGPKEAIDALPPNLLTLSAWTEEGVRQPPRPLRTDLAFLSSARTRAAW